MEVAVVQVIHVAIMLNGGVTAVGTMLMIVMHVLGTTHLELQGLVSEQ